MTPGNSKAELRATLRARRAALTPRQQAHAAQQVVARVVVTRPFRAARRIACYLPSNGEIDPLPLLERIWVMKKQCFLPILSRLTRDRLWFAPTLPDTPLVLNRFGIPEPDVAARNWIRAQDLDLIFMPLVGFDRDGNRLGMGGGFYDRSLDFLRHRERWRKPHLIGLAHDFQRVARLTPSPWDVPMQAVITDRAVYVVRR